MSIISSLVGLFLGKSVKSTTEAGCEAAAREVANSVKDWVINLDLDDDIASVRSTHRDTQRLSIIANEADTPLTIEQQVAALEKLKV